MSENYATAFFSAHDKLPVYWLDINRYKLGAYGVSLLSYQPITITAINSVIHSIDSVYNPID